MKYEATNAVFTHWVSSIVTIAKTFNLSGFFEIPHGFDPEPKVLFVDHILD